MINNDKEIQKHFDSIFNTQTVKDIELNMPFLNKIYDNISEQLSTTNEKYKHLRHQKIQLEDKLYEILTENQLKLYKEICDIDSRMKSIMEHQLWFFGVLTSEEIKFETTQK